VPPIYPRRRRAAARFSRTTADVGWSSPSTRTDVGELVRLTGTSRPTPYRRLAEHAKAGRAAQVSRGRWRTAITEEPPR
jgi:hypothetical protein